MSDAVLDPASIFLHTCLWIGADLCSAVQCSAFQAAAMCLFQTSPHLFKTLWQPHAGSCFSVHLCPDYGCPWSIWSWSQESDRGRWAWSKAPPPAPALQSHAPGAQRKNRNEKSRWRTAAVYLERGRKGKSASLTRKMSVQSFRMRSTQGSSSNMMECDISLKKPRTNLPMTKTTDTYKPMILREPGKQNEKSTLWRAG